MSKQCSNAQLRALQLRAQHMRVMQWRRRGDAERALKLVRHAVARAHDCTAQIARCEVVKRCEVSVYTQQWLHARICVQPSAQALVSQVPWATVSQITWTNIIRN